MEYRVNSIEYRVYSIEFKVKCKKKKNYNNLKKRLGVCSSF